jgi:hypothetical protein
MKIWYVIFVGIVFISLIIIPLRRRWYMGCGLGLLGAIIGGGAGFGLGWCYLTYAYTPPPRRDINDWSGLVVAAFWLLGIPAIGVVLGSVLGIWSAYLLRELVADEPPTKPGPIDS